MPIVIPFAMAAAISLALVPICGRSAARFGYIAHPRTERWHSKSVLLFGGVAIAAAVFLGLLVLGDLSWRPEFIVCTAVIFITGFVDDLKELGASIKFTVQFIVAIVLLLSGYGLYWTNIPILDATLTVLWIVGITNAFNLLDNMDGLCAGVAFIAGMTLLLGLFLSDPGTAAFGDMLYLALLLGAIAGFFVYNIHPASVFMGDAGSLLLGVSLASMTLTNSSDFVPESSLLSIAAPPLFILLVPILDTAMVMCTRTLAGRSCFVGGRDHISHRLVALGWSERRAVALLWALAALGGAVGWATKTLDTDWSMLLVSVFLIGIALFLVYIARVRVYDIPAQVG